MKLSKLQSVTPRGSAPVVAHAVPREGRTPRPRVRDIVAGEYDGSSFDRTLANHFRYAQGFAPNIAANPADREILRNRCRHEAANNCYAAGMIRTIANDTIGTGPRLQLAGADTGANREIERAFAEHLNLIDAAAKLRHMRAAKVRDGGAFGVLRQNPGLDAAVKLDLMLVEDERVGDDHAVSLADQPERWVEGIKFDAHDNPVAFRVRKEHPGDQRHFFKDDYDDLPAGIVIHYYHSDRIGQARGLPEMAPALILFGQLRRLTLASIDAMEAAANIALALQTNMSPDTEADALQPFDVIDLERNMATVLPEGYQLGQVKAEHPSTQYQAIKRELLNEIARCLNVPYNVAAGNSSDYNFASGRLDHQGYWRMLQVERAVIGRVILDRLFARWLDEIVIGGAGVLSRAARRVIPAVGVPEHTWHWDGFKHVDPVKEATADLIRLNAGMTTYADVYAERGQDWEQQFEQRQREAQKLAELGLDQNNENDAAGAAVSAALASEAGGQR